MKLTSSGTSSSAVFKRRNTSCRMLVRDSLKMIQSWALAVEMPSSLIRVSFPSSRACSFVPSNLQFINFTSDVKPPNLAGKQNPGSLKLKKHIIARKWQHLRIPMGSSETRVLIRSSVCRFLSFPIEFGMSFIPVPLRFNYLK